MLVKGMSAFSDNPEIYQQRVKLSVLMSKKRDSFESQADVKSISI